MKDIIKKDWKFFCVLTISMLALLLMCFYSLKVSDKTYHKSEDIGYNDYIKENTEGTKIVQKFIATGNNLERIDINFEPLKEKANVGGIIKIEIVDENGHVIKQDTITRNYIRENNKYSVKFNMQKDSEGHAYKLILELEDLDGHNEFYSVRYNDKVEDVTRQLTVNGKSVSGILDFQHLYKSNLKMAFFTAILIGFSILIYIICTIIYYKKNIKIENIFLMTVTPIAIMFLITMPTFKNHDELYHWYKSYELSIGKLTTGLENGVQGTKMPNAVGEILYSDWTKMNYGELREKFQIKLNNDKVALLDSGTSAVYSFVQYIPQATGITITRMFTDNVMLMTYGGRIANLAASILLIYFAIKLIPFGKKILLLVSYIPIAIEGFSSLSPDAMTISLSLFYIGYILYLAYDKDKKVEIKEKIILTISSIILALCKIVYIPLVALMLIIPKEKFVVKNGKNQKKKIINIFVIAGIAIILNLLWLAFSSRYLANFRDGDSKYQVIEALKNPIQYIQICLHSLNINGQSYIASMFGMVLGWGELIQVYSIVPYVLFIMLIFATIVDDSIKEKFELWQKIIITLVILAIIALIFTSLYVQWTTVGSKSILGIQGRYFIPILPLAAILIGSVIKVENKYKDENIIKTIAITGIIIQIIVIAQIIITHL